MAGTDDTVLRWVRDLIAKRGFNTAELARKSGIERTRLRKLLSGSEPMLVEELMRISSTLELSPADMGLPHVDEDAVIEVPERPASTLPDPYGNHPRQLFEVGFGLGCNFYFAADVTELADSGVPASVLDQHRSGRGELVLSLNAAHHRDNDPRLDDAGVTLTLSFDALYDCTFPWSSIRRVIFEVEHDPDDVSPPPEDSEPSGGPHLRLVT